MAAETETRSVKVHTTGSVPNPGLQAVPMTDLAAGEHEAGMVARVSHKEEATANVDTEEILGCSTLIEPDKEEIDRRAYDIYLARGQAAGQEMDDWIEAKRQLLEESNSKFE